MISSTDRLLAQLNATQLQQKDNPTYQVIKQLIARIKDLESLLNASSGSVTDISNKTFITSTNETASLPNSRELIAGNNIELDESISGQITINALDFNVGNLESDQIIELFRYAFKRLDLIENLLNIHRTFQDIRVPQDELELIQEDKYNNIGTDSMR